MKLGFRSGPQHVNAGKYRDVVLNASGKLKAQDFHVKASGRRFPGALEQIAVRLRGTSQHRYGSNGSREQRLVWTGMVLGSRLRLLVIPAGRRVSFTVRSDMASIRRSTSRTATLAFTEGSDRVSTEDSEAASMAAASAEASREAGLRAVGSAGANLSARLTASPIFVACFHHQAFLPGGEL